MRSGVTKNRPETAWKYPDLGPKMRPPQIGTKYTPESVILHGEWVVEIGGLKNPGQDIGIFFCQKSLQKITNSRVTKNRPETAWKYPDLGPKIRPPQIGTKYTPKSAILHGEWGPKKRTWRALVRTEEFCQKSLQDYYTFKSNIK